MTQKLRGLGMPDPPDWRLDEWGLNPFEVSEWATGWAYDASLRGDLGRCPGQGLSQVAGMPDLKAQLDHEVIGPFRNPELYSRYRVSLPNGILFYGPPGCGKTYIGKSLAEELGWSFQHCRPSDVASPFIHDTVSKIRAIFTRAIKEAPSVVFIDEFEAFVPARSELGGHQQYKVEEVNEFLANLEGCAERKVLVIAATNEPEKIDPAVRRSGRFDKLIFIPPPDAEARRAMLGFHLQDRPVETPLDAAGVATVLGLVQPKPPAGSSLHSFFFAGVRKYRTLPVFRVNDLGALGITVLRPFPKEHGIQVLVHSNDHPPPHIHVRVVNADIQTRYSWPGLAPLANNPRLASQNEKGLRLYVKKFGDEINAKVQKVYGTAL